MTFGSDFESVFFQIVSQISAPGFREIDDKEREILENQSNVFTHGCCVFISSSSPTLLDRIRNNIFIGSCVLFLAPGGAVVNNTLTNVWIDTSSVVKDNAMISNTFIGANCSIINNGIISGDFAKNLFGLANSEIVLGEETGSRSIYRHPDMSLETVSRTILSKSTQSEWNNCVTNSLNRISSGSENHVKYLGSVLSNNNTVIKNSEISNLFLADSNNTIIGSTLSGCVVRGTGNKISNSVLIDSTLSNHTIVDSFSFIENSAICEHVKISVHAKVVHSLIGSYSGVESGECVSSLVGPFVGFHHQSLLIATYWPSGRGNVGYGANVGSNHTGKAPDQELLAGEGVFFGLATIIKFPSNFLEAPYSLIASGVTCLPQKVSFPYSLINTGSLSEHPGYNEIFPAWIISDNMFTLIRNEEKFRKRQKDDAKIVYHHEVFRPDTMALVKAARDILAAVLVSKPVYTDSDIPGLGKNYLKESARLKAIDTYSFILRWYSLRGLYRQIKSRGVESVRKNDGEWGFEKSILVGENMNLNELRSLLNEFAKLDHIVANSCVTSKGKDDVRGVKIIGPMYNEFHAPASSHAVCVNAKKNADAVEIDIESILSKL
jgi:hypothetical protein